MKKEKEEMLEKLRKIKAMENNRLAINRQEDEIKIQDVVYIGKATITDKTGEQETQKEINVYAVLEGKTIKYFSDDMCLGYETEGVGVIPSQEYSKVYEKDNPIKDLIESLKQREAEEQEKSEVKGEEKSLKKLEEEKVKEYAGALGKDKEDIEEVNEISLTDEEDESSINQQDASHLTQREETDLNQVIKGEALRNLLGLSGEYVKIAIVSSSQANQYVSPENQNTNKDSFVAIKANGECTVLGKNIIGPDEQEGENTTDRDLTINHDGSVDYKQNTSSYKVMNKPGFYLTVGYDESFGKEIKIAERSRYDGSKDIEYELETQTTWPIDEDARELRMERSGINKTDEIDEKQQAHENLGDKNERVENIDNIEENDLENISNLANQKIKDTDKTWRQFANECGFRGKDAIDKAARKLIEYKKDNPDLSNQDLVDGVIEREKEDFRAPDLDHKLN